MAKTARFNIGFQVLDRANEHIFLSVTEGFEHGPGIQRDGITPPRMTDPHSVPRICHHYGLEIRSDLPPTTDAHVQRAGTWTLYHHLKRFINAVGNEWQIVGVQSNGDLTMNHWHIAYIGSSHVSGQDGTLCALLTDNDKPEPVSSRIYHCLVKWNDAAAQLRHARCECLNLRIESAGHGHALRINDQTVSDQCNKSFASLGPLYNQAHRDIAPLVDFVLSGKPVVEDGVELSLANAIDRFEDIRHIYNLPEVPAVGFYGQPVSRVNFGEYQLYQHLNTRRAALSAPVIIDLNIEGHVIVKWEDVVTALKARHFKETHESPTRRGQFRRYQDQANREKVEVFLPHNVYPFGVLGIQEDTSKPGAPSNLVCLSSGGLSGRVGNTLEGIARIMFDFFGCIDSIVLDEGYDVFFLANPQSETGYTYTNEQILQKVLTFTANQVNLDHDDFARAQATRPPYPLSGGMKGWPLNVNMMDEIEKDIATAGPVDYSDVLLVQPLRSQMRSVLIFAVRKTQDHTESTEALAEVRSVAAI